jgi:hypothetical protein
MVTRTRLNVAFTGTLPVLFGFIRKSRSTVSPVLFGVGKLAVAKLN